MPNTPDVPPTLPLHNPLWKQFAMEQNYSFEWYFWIIPYVCIFFELTQLEKTICLTLMYILRNIDVLCHSLNNSDSLEHLS